jgi:DNA-binding NtrC family response regulator
MSNRAAMIVVVDADSDRAGALSMRLDRSGYHVVRRSCGIDALRYVTEYRPELVLSEADLLDCESHELLVSISAISPSTQVLFIVRPGRNPSIPQHLEHHVLRQKAEPGATDELVQAVERILHKTPQWRHA